MNDLTTIESLNHQLNDIKKQVIGIVIYNLHQLIFDLVINIDDILETIDTIHISQWGAVSTTSISKYTLHNCIELVLFPEGKTLTEMLRNPFEFNEFCVKHLKA